MGDANTEINKLSKSRCPDVTVDTVVQKGLHSQHPPASILSLKEKRALPSGRLILRLEEQVKSIYGGDYSRYTIKSADGKLVWLK